MQSLPLWFTDLISLLLAVVIQYENAPDFGKLTLFSSPGFGKEMGIQSSFPGTVSLPWLEACSLGSGFLFPYSGASVIGLKRVWQPLWVFFCFVFFLKVQHITLGHNSELAKAGTRWPNRSFPSSVPASLYFITFHMAQLLLIYASVLGFIPLSFFCGQVIIQQKIFSDTRVPLSRLILSVTLFLLDRLGDKDSLD